MKLKCFFYTLFIIVLITTSCNQPAEELKPTEEAFDVLAGTPFSRNTKHENCLFIVHDVKNYDFWKAMFDLAESLRVQNGMSTLNVYQDLQNLNRAYVMTSIENFEKAKTYISSDDLNKSIENAGVISIVNLYWLQTELTFNKEITDTIPMYMSFNVMNYEKWENAFLNDFRDNSNYDFQVLKVYRGVEDSNQVTMLFAVNDPDYIEKKEKDNTFRMKMLASGVISYPITYKMKQMPI